MNYEKKHFGNCLIVSFDIRHFEAKMNTLARIVAAVTVWAGAASFATAFLLAAVYAERPALDLDVPALFVVPTFLAVGSLMYLIGHNLNEVLITFNFQYVSGRATGDRMSDFVGSADLISSRNRKC